MAQVELSIVLNSETGQVQVRGPLHLRMQLVYALEEAKRLVQNFDPAKHRPSLALPNGPLPKVEDVR